MVSSDQSPKEVCGTVCALYCSADSPGDSVVCDLCPLGLLESTFSTDGEYTYSIARDCDDEVNRLAVPTMPLSPGWRKTNN